MTVQVFGEGMETPPALATLLCFSHLRWDFVWQRPQHLLSRAARQYDVFFVEEPVFEGARQPELIVRTAPCGVKVVHLRVPPGTPDEVVQCEMRRHMKRLDQPGRRLVTWFYTPMALPFAESLSADIAVYDCMDDLQSFAGAPPAMASMERMLLDHVQLVLTGGRSLFESRRNRHRNVHLFPSSIDASHFGRARMPGRQPADQEPIPRPRIGFFGVIDERMDLALLAGIARIRPDWNLVMIGPTAKIDPDTLPRPQNIHWLGPKPYGELPDYLRGWDAGFMPFALNDATRHISPTKTPEFLAAGIPLVSTSIADVVADYPAVVRFADSPGEFVAQLEAAMDNRGPAFWQEVDRRLARSSWDGVWLEIDRLISRPLGTSIRAGGINA